MAPRSALCALALSTSALTAGAVFLPSAVQAVIVWDWSLTSDGGVSALGTFETDGVTPEANTFYKITSISGIFTEDGENYDIDGTDGVWGLIILFSGMALISLHW